MTDLAVRLLRAHAVTLWKFTRVLQKKDVAFGRLSEALGKTSGDVWRPFGKWPLIEEAVAERERALVGSRAYVFGQAYLTMPADVRVMAAVASLLNASEFADSGLLLVSAGVSQAGSARTVTALRRLLGRLIEYRAKTYLSQAEWERDLGLKTVLFVEAIRAPVRDGILVLLPLINANVEVALLGICVDKYVEALGENGAEGDPLDDSGAREWELGLFR